MAARLEVGRVDKAHGVRGDVIVTLTTNRDERVAPGTVLWIGDRALAVVSSRPHQHRWIVHFEGVETREAAEALHDRVLAADPIDDPDELWVHELIGATVVDTAGVTRGSVVTVEDNPAADLLVLDGGALVPMTFVVGFDRPSDGEPGRVTIDPPDGLFDL